MVASPLLNDPADERLETVLADYLRAVEAGRAPERMELLARHPDLASELAAFFAGQERFARLAEPLREAIAVVHQSAVEDKLGEGGRLGDFRLLREIGRGGMGVVYEAEQISLNRRVALKVLPFASTLDQRQLQRFRNEAQAAAGLQHQNIVPVYFVGKERGVHFYAMQYVEGRLRVSLHPSARRAAGLRRLFLCPSPRKTTHRSSTTVVHSFLWGSRLLTIPHSSSTARQPSRKPPTIRCTPAIFSAPWRESVFKLRKRWNTPTRWASSTGT